MRALGLAAAALSMASPVSASDDAGSPLRIRTAEAADWGPLNPARGDQSPQAGTQLGDLQGEGPAGFLLRPVDGFSSPPHIHDMAYRGVVIRGELHNDDPGAAHAWMPPGSFWTQPAGEAHITAARGADVLAWIEIDAAPYRVLPADQAAPDHAPALNLHADNVVWQAHGDAELAPMWGVSATQGGGGSLLRLPPGAQHRQAGAPGGQAAVSITGTSSAHRQNGSRTALPPGSVVEAAPGTPLALSCEGPEACRLYIRWSGPDAASHVPGGAAGGPH